MLIPSQPKQKTFSYPFAWCPKYLPYVSQLFQNDFQNNEYLKKIKIFNCILCSKICSNEMLKVKDYEQHALVVAIPSGKPIRMKLSKEKNNEGFKDEKKFIEEVYDAIYSTIFESEYFEERLIYSLESFGGEKPIDEFTYPYKNKDDYTSMITKFIARDHGSTKKSTNLQRPENPQV